MSLLVNELSMRVDPALRGRRRVSGVTCNRAAAAAGDDAASEPTLTDLLEESAATEVLDKENSYYCDKCRRKCKATRRTRLHHAPEVLVVRAFVRVCGRAERRAVACVDGRSSVRLELGSVHLADD